MAVFRINGQSADLNVIVIQHQCANKENNVSNGSNYGFNTEKLSLHWKKYHKGKKFHTFQLETINTLV